MEPDSPPPSPGIYPRDWMLGVGRQTSRGYFLLHSTSSLAGIFSKLTEIKTHLIRHVFGYVMFTIRVCVCMSPPPSSINSSSSWATAALHARSALASKLIVSEEAEQEPLGGLQS